MSPRINPEMTPERWQRIKELFHAAAELGPSERGAFLDANCAGDSAARAEVESLLAAHEREGEFLYETPARERVRRFEQEARAASALNHPNILTVYDIGQEGGARFIATEYVEGETL